MINLIKPASQGNNDSSAEFYTVEATGESGINQTGLAALCGVSSSAIFQLEKTLLSRAPSKWLKPFVGKDLILLSTDSEPNLTVNQKPVSKLKIYRSDFCSAVIRHYAFQLADDGQPNEIAQESLAEFTDIGVEVWIQRITGWQAPLTPAALPSHTTVYIRRLENVRDHRVDDNYWTTFREGSEVLLLVEKDYRVPIEKMDLCDGSIGSHWSQYRMNESWAKCASAYTHFFQDHRGEQQAKAYHITELPYFKAWLREHYIPLHLPKYLVDKYGKRAVHQIYGEIGQLNDYILELSKEKRPSLKQQELYEMFLRARAGLSQQLTLFEVQSEPSYFK